MSNVTLSAKKEKDCPYPLYRELTFTDEIVILGPSIENSSPHKGDDGKKIWPAGLQRTGGWCKPAAAAICMTGPRAACLKRLRLGQDVSNRVTGKGLVGG
jgi:hypothetical protein